MHTSVSRLSRDPTRLLYVVALFVYVMALYPAILERTEQAGFDAPIYYAVGRGFTDYTVFNGRGEEIGFIYSERTLPVWRLWAKLSYPTALAVLVLGSAFGIAATGGRVLAARGRYPRLVWFVALAVGIKASDTVQGGNISGLLAGLCLTPWGALLAGCIKPYLFVFVVLHAALAQARTQRLPVSSRQPGLLSCGVRSSGRRRGG